MKPQPALHPARRLLQIRYPRIHPEDAWNALVRRAGQKVEWSLERLKKKAQAGVVVERVEKAIDDVFLAVLADVPPEQWTDSAWHEIGVRVRETKGKFWKRLVARRRRRSLFTPEDLFLLENWRVLRFGNPDPRPGLREWHPDHVRKLLREKGLHDGGEKWFQKRRLSLGLTPSPYTYP